jgi:hypothetical protein
VENGKSANKRNQENSTVLFLTPILLVTLSQILIDSLKAVNGIKARVFPIEEDIFYMGHQELVKPHSFRQ